MAVRSNEEILEILRTRMGDDISSDENISFLEDMSDTLNDLSERASGQENWKEKYETNDAEWRKKYTDRFFSGSDNNDDVDDKVIKENDESETPVTFEDLFKEEE